MGKKESGKKLGAKKKILSMLGGGAFTLFMAAIFLSPIIPLTAGKAAGYYPALMKALASCPEAVDKLGANPRVGIIGLNTGSCSSSGSSYSASGRMPVKGDKSSGKLVYAISKSGGTTTLYSATLTVDGKSIDVASCLKGSSFGGAKEPPMPKEWSL